MIFSDSDDAVNNKLQVTTLTMPGEGRLSQKRLRPRECLLDCKDKKTKCVLKDLFYTATQMLLVGGAVASWLVC